MFQRIQTLYMILALLAMVVLYIWFPVVVDEASTITLDVGNPLIVAPIIGIVFLTLFSIINFKKRQLQFVLNRLSIVLNFVLLGVFVYKSLSVPGETLVSQKGIGVLLPIISIVLLVMANKAIKRDEDLVKSVDRLR